MNLSANLMAIGRSFTSRNYTLFFLGQSLSLLGNWITKTTILWLAYDLTHSPIFLGIIGFLSQIPNLVVTPFAGVIIERYQRRQVLIVAHTLSITIFLSLGFLTLEGFMTSWLLLTLSVMQGLVNSVALPARQTFLGDIVTQKEDISNATALHSSLATICRILGPGIAGFLIANIDAGYCFLLDGLSYIAVIIALSLMKINPSSQESFPASYATKISLFKNLQEGYRYVFGFLPMRMILLQVAAMSFLGMSYRSLLPIWVTEIVKGDATTLGYLMGATGIGALLAALYLSARPSVVGFEEILTFSPAIWGGALVAFCLVNNWFISLGLMAVIGAASLLVISASNALLQTIADENKRGRVMSFYTMAMMGILPLGELFMGFLTQSIGVTYTLMTSGIGCVVIAILLAINLPNLQLILRPIYIKNNLLSS
jgi:MFS family permease